MNWVSIFSVHQGLEEEAGLVFIFKNGFPVRNQKALNLSPLKVLKQ